MGIETAIGFAIIGYGLAAAGVYGATQLSKLSKKPILKGTAPAALPEAPSAAEATPEQKARIRRKTKTILAEPLTGAEEFGTPPPTLLGTGDVTKKQTLG